MKNTSKSVSQDAGPSRGGAAVPERRTRWSQDARSGGGEGPRAPKGAPTRAISANLSNEDTGRPQIRGPPEPGQQRDLVLERSSSGSLRGSHPRAVAGTRLPSSCPLPPSGAKTAARRGGQGTPGERASRQAWEPHVPGQPWVDVRASRVSSKGVATEEVNGKCQAGAKPGLSLLYPRPSAQGSPQVGQAGAPARTVPVSLSTAWVS